MLLHKSYHIRFGCPVTTTFGQELSYRMTISCFYSFANYGSDLDIVFLIYVFFILLELLDTKCCGKVNYNLNAT